ncbi:MAG: vesicle formation at the endoplasmic reticulum, partial [Watsoniomyces obsoletus]
AVARALTLAAVQAADPRFAETAIAHGASGWRTMLTVLHEVRFAVFAAIISNLNSVRFSMGMRPLGFLNPLLYGAGRQGLTDIVQGGSTGCRGKVFEDGKKGKFVPYAGWNATEGWDPVTGLGTPMWKGLVGAALFATGQ